MSGLAYPLRWLVEWLRGGQDEGVSSMNADQAITYAPVWHAVNKICGHVGQLPLSVHKRTDQGSEHAKRHAGFKLMRRRPNAYQTPFIFKEQLTCHALLWGNGRAYILRDQSGTPIELIPLMPDRTLTGMIEGEKMHATKPTRDDRFDLVTDMRQSPEETVIIHDTDVLHIPGLGFDGVEGKSLLKIAAESWGIGKGAESRASTQLRRGYSGGLMLEAPAGMFRKEEDAKEFLEFFRKNHDGDENAGKTGLLRDGVKANVLQMSNSDAQFLEQRRFQRQDAALWFLLEQILGDDSSVSYNSLEQKNLGYLSSCLMRWLCKWEEECNEKLLSDKEKEKDSHYFKFNVAALLRADYKTTIDSLSLAINARIMNPNEAREKLDMNSYEGGDEYANPAITPGQAGDEEDNTEDDQPEPEDSNSRRSQAAVVEMVKSLLKREANDAVNGANKKDFLQWMDRYYAKWEPKLADKLESIGIDRDVAREHCKQSIAELLDISGKSTPDNIKANVELIVESWPERAHRIAENTYA